MLFVLLHFNPLPPIESSLTRIPKFRFKYNKGSYKKFPLSAEYMSRQTIGTYVKSYLENRTENIIHEVNG